MPQESETNQVRKQSTLSYAKSLVADFEEGDVTMRLSRPEYSKCFYSATEAKVAEINAFDMQDWHKQHKHLTACKVRIYQLSSRSAQLSASELAEKLELDR